MINYGSHTITEDDIENVTKCLRNEVLARGPVIKSYETTFANITNAKYACSYNSATSALKATILATLTDHDINNGWECITTPLSFIATTNAILLNGGSPYYIDTDIHGNLDINKVLEYISTNYFEIEIAGKLQLRAVNSYKHLRVIMPVYFAGRPIDDTSMKLLYDHSKKYNYSIIIDAAHALGSYTETSITGDCKYANATVFSTHPVKHITTGEGGMITTNDLDLHNYVSTYRDNGRNNGIHIMVGDNHWMSSINAKLGLSQLNRLKEIILARQNIALMYEYITDSYITKPERIDGHAWHIYTIQVDPGIRADLQLYLAKNGVGTAIHYPLITESKYMKTLLNSNPRYKPTLLPNARKITDSSLTIPCHLNLTMADIHLIINSLHEFSVAM